MATFQDGTGREWRVEVTFAHLKLLREKFGIQTNAKAREFFTQLSDVIGDPEKLYELLCHLCKSQVAEVGGPEAFAELLNGSVIREAAVAVTDAVFDFCQGPNAAKEMSGAIRAAMTETDRKIATVMQREFPKLISKLQDGNWPESSESTPTREPSVN